MTIDPVCGMSVDEHAINASNIERDGKKFHFCTNLCRLQFEMKADKFLSEEWQEHIRLHETKTKNTL